MAACLVLCVWLTAAALSADSTHVQPITGADQAIHALKQYTGFDRSPVHKGRAFNARAKLAVGTVISSPFDHDMTDSAAIWQVSVDSVVLDMPIIDSMTEWNYPRSFDVFMDSETGMFLKAVSRSGRIEDSLLGDAWVDLPESLHVRKLDIIKTPTNERPIVTLYEALNDGCMMSLLSASEIVAYYVECRTSRGMAVTWIDQTPAPAWLIISKQLKSPPPSFRNSKATPVQEPVVESCFINARTGVPSGTLTTQRSRSFQGENR